MPENEHITPPSDATILAALQRQSIDLLLLDFKPFLEKLADHLLKRASRVKSGTSGYNAYYDAMNSIQQNKSVICNILKAELCKHYEDVTREDEDVTPEDEGRLQQNKRAKSKSQRSSSPHKLDLIDVQKFETHLAINKMIESGSESYRIPLECLTIRLATLVGEDPNKVHLPVHVDRISRAFPRSLRGREIPKEVIPDILLEFDRSFIDKLDGYYEALNLLLRNADILPNLEEEVKASGTLLKPKKKKLPERPGPKIKKRAQVQTEAQAKTGIWGSPLPNDDATADPTHSQGTTSASGDHFSPEALYNSVITALNFKREADAPLSTPSRGNNTPQPNLADPPSIAQALGALQQSPDVRAAIQQTASLQEYLTTNRGAIGGLRDTEGLSQESTNQLNLVDNLFDTIKSKLDVTSELKPTLGELQIPLAKLALLEPQFFVDPNHSARGVVDKLAQLATSANFPNKALEGRIGKIIDTIITDYDDDSSVFDTALAKVERLVAQQASAQERNRDRVIKTQEGQQKLKSAQMAAAAIINERITPPEAPQVLVELIESGLRDLLVITHIREGHDSNAWNEQVRTLDLLSLWLSERQEEAIDEDMLMARSLEAESLIDMISQQISAALPTSVAHEAPLDNLRKILKGQQSITMIPVAPSLPTTKAEPEIIRSKIKSLPRINRWVQRVEQLQKGAWLNYKDKKGLKRRMQLAWVSDHKDRFIFVNELGQRHADLTAVQLARQLSRGVKPPTVADKLSLIDQSMYDTLEHVQKSLSFARNHDSLTRLINYETFKEQLARALGHAQRKHSQHAVLYLNIDQFDLVNQVFDETYGDLVLHEFAQLLSQLHGKKTSSCRIQGDEFGVLLLDQSIEQAVSHADQIRTDIEASSVEIDGENVTFTVSIGVAPIRNYSPGVQEVVDFAKSAMLLAKERGRNQVVEFEEDQGGIEHYRKSQLEAKSRIQTTLETNRFALRAQPIVQTSMDGSDAESQHFELLLGLTNKDGSLSSPLEFIASAERYGYMGLVDRWVVKEAFTWISQLMDSEKIVPSLSINLSGSSITDDSFMDYLLEQISEFGVGTSKLCFEITETGSISNLVKAADFVQVFRNIGCKFSIDDFGTGLASHNYLRELPVDYVKIDGTFIKEIDTNRNDYAMTRSINDLAHFLGQKTIAESVENVKIIEKLTEIGVDYLQGWGIGRPKLLTDITADLADIAK